MGGFIGVTVLLVSVSLTLVVWTCCLRGTPKSGWSPGPPLRFIHMLKGVSVYQETPSPPPKPTLLPVGWERRRGKEEEEEEGGGETPTGVQLGPGEAAGLEPLTPGGPGAGPAPELGTLSLAVDYNFPKKALVVSVAEAGGLPALGADGLSSDPYVKLTVLPEAKHRVKTRVVRRTLRPQFDETFTFYGLTHPELRGVTLHFLVLHSDRYSRDPVIGEVSVPLDTADPGAGPIQLTRDILARSVQRSVCRGELLVSLCYQPFTHKMAIGILKARHLPTAGAGGPSDPYVKVNVFHGAKRIAKKKTHVKRSTPNPVFNESFVFALPPEFLPGLSLQFLVIDFDHSSKNEVVGRLLLGATGGAAGGAEHWGQVLQYPRRQVAKWHTLTD